MILAGSAAAQIPESGRQREAAALAVRHLQEHPKQFGLSPGDSPVEEEVRIERPQFTGDWTAARVTFAGQKHRGVLVEGTSIFISVNLDRRQVYAASGTWRKVAIDCVPVVEQEEARRRLIGIEAGTVAGLPKLRIAVGDVAKAGQIVVMEDWGPHPADRLAWKILVQREPFSWNAYVDAKTGDVVRLQPLFIE